MLVAVDDGHADVVLAFTVRAYSVSWSLFWALPHSSKRHNSLSPEYHGRGERKKNLLQN